MKNHWLIVLLVLAAAELGFSQPQFPGPEQSPVLKELPDPFQMNDGQRVSTQKEWQQRRQEIADMLLHYEYGHPPPRPRSVAVENETVRDACSGQAKAHEFLLRMNGKGGFALHSGVMVPTRGGPRFPVIVAIDSIFQPHAEAKARRFIERGYAVAGFVYHDLDNDKGARTNGVYAHYPDSDGGSLAMWAWGAMRVADYLATRADIDVSRMALTGHSRCGKAALLAGALDERFGLVAPHASGAGGEGSFRIQPKGVETLELITQPTRFHYWFSPRLRQFAGKEDRLPFDQHFLKALVAPRGLLTMIGLADVWANPEGTQQTHLAALPVFAFLNAADRAALWFRPGGHDEEPQDWTALCDYADYTFYGKPASNSFNRLPFPGVPKAFSWSAPRPIP
jgi:hypothetical protein